MTNIRTIDDVIDVIQTDSEVRRRMVSALNVPGIDTQEKVLASVDRLTQNVDNLTTTVAEQGKSIDNLTTNVDNLTTTVADQGKSIDNLAKTTSDQGKSIDNLAKTTSDQGKSIDNLAKTTSDQSKSIDNLAKTTSDQGKSIDNLAKTTSDQGKSIDNLAKTTSDQGRYIDNLAKTTSDQGRYIDNLTKTTSDQGRYIDNLAKTTSDQGRYIDNLAKTTSDQGRYIDNLARTVGEQGRNIDNLSISLESLRGVVGDLSARVLGNDTEDRAVTKIISDLGVLFRGVRGTRLMYAQHGRLGLNDDYGQIVQAARDNDEIEPTDFRRLVSTDIVVSARREGRIHIFPAEVSNTLSKRDVDQAVRTSSLISQVFRNKVGPVTGTEYGDLAVQPMVAGAVVPDLVQDHADSLDVEVVTVNVPTMRSELERQSDGTG